LYGQQTLHKQAVDTTSHDYRAPFNTLTNASSVATPEDKFVVTPNSDSPYSYLWMDLRAEPIVVTMPAIEKESAEVRVRISNRIIISTGAWRSGEICGSAELSWGCFDKATRRQPDSKIRFAYCVVSPVRINPIACGTRFLKITCGS
jgi:Protein of unknown function (DUF1254)